MKASLCLTKCEVAKSENLSMSIRCFSGLKDHSLDGFGYVSKILQERLPKQSLLAKVTGKRPVGRPRTRWLDHIKDLIWNRLGLQLSEVEEVVKDRDVGRLNLELLPPQPSQIKRT